MTKKKPPHQDKKWFWDQLMKCGSLAEMQRRWGFSDETYNRWAKRHGISMRPRLTPEQKDLILEGLVAGDHLQEIAWRAGVSIGTVRRYRVLLGG